jgi:hypothetical protein
VLFFSTLSGSAGLSYSGDLTDTGLTALGIPLLLTVILLRLSHSGTLQRDGTGRGAAPQEQTGAVESGLPLTNVPGAYDRL